MGRPDKTSDQHTKWGFDPTKEAAFLYGWYDHTRDSAKPVIELIEMTPAQLEYLCHEWPQSSRLFHRLFQLRAECADRFKRMVMFNREDA